jgi:hypothetical protein
MRLCPLMLEVVKEGAILRELVWWMFDHPDINAKLHFSERYEEIVSATDSYDNLEVVLETYCAEHLPARTDRE